MRTPHRTLSRALIVLACLALAPHAGAESRRRPKPATKADIERLEEKIEQQQRVIDRMVALQREYLQRLIALSDGTPLPPLPPPPPPGDNPAAAAASPTDPKPQPSSVAGDLATPAVARPAAKPVKAAKPARVAKADLTAPPEKAYGTIVGKVKGAPGAIIYVEDIVVTGHGSAEMRQEGKQFLPKVLVVQKGTKVAFPNADAIFHNVFSVSPDNSFDLGSYRQGESKSVTMAKPGVVTVYCNMHPQMVGHILVVPNGNYVRAGADGFFRLTNVPAGPHRIVAWAPNAKPAKVQATVGADQVVTIEVALSKTGSTMHTKKDGMPYGSYEQ